MRSSKFCPISIFFMALAVLLSIYPVASLLTNSIIISSSGQIVNPNVTAESGSATDIQTAVDWVVAHAGVGNVYIPEGTWNFVEVGETWVTVNVPAGVNIFGASTERDVNGQVTEWKTVLVMPYETPTGSVWFKYTLDNNNPKTFRFSDIKMVGWRFFDQTSTTRYVGISMRVPYSEYGTSGFKGFRIDHCNFQDMCGSAVSAELDMPPNNRRSLQGVIDHNRIVNSYGYPGQMDYNARTLDYGIALRRWACDVWDSNLQNIWGKYTDYTVVIEDNYFSKWRHDISINDGLHAIVRNNIFDGDYGQGVVDGHGSYADDSRPYAVGTRCMEIYDNTFQNPDLTWTNTPWAINVRGGSFLITSNNFSGYSSVANLQNDWGYTMVPETRVNGTYIWANNLGGADIVGYNDGSVTLGTHYYLTEPTGYTPYPYPHYLTVE